MVRGTFALVDSLRIGMRALEVSAVQSESGGPEDEAEDDDAAHGSDAAEEAAAALARAAALAVEAAAATLAASDDDSAEPAEVTSETVSERTRRSSSGCSPQSGRCATRSTEKLVSGSMW
jgi:hypothetical protein